MKLDILIFAAHPDDAELGCSGTILKHIAQGKKVGIIDLTRGELGTRGTPEIRAAEAAEATKIMGIHARENLNMRDGFFKNDEEHQLKVIQMLRKYSPKIVLANAYYDRHPDHGRACNLVNDAIFLSGLIQIKTTLDGEVQQAWRPQLTLHYIQGYFIKPDILVDITDVWEKRMECAKAFKSQFYNPDEPDQPQTRLSSPHFFKAMEARFKEFGNSINTMYAEGFTCRRSLGVNDLFHLK